MKYQQFWAICCLLTGTLLCLQLQENYSVSYLQGTTEIDSQICSSGLIKGSRTTTFGFDVSTLRQNLINGQPDLKIQALLQNQSHDNQMNTLWQTLYLGVPWIGMLFLFCIQFILLNSCYCNCCPWKCCKCCKIRRRKPLNKKELQMNSKILVFICMTAVLGPGIAAIIQTEDFINDVEKISCSSIQMTQSIQTGTNNGDYVVTKWIGLKNMQNLLNQIYEYSDQFINQQSALQAQINITQLNDSYNSLISINQQIPTQLPIYSYFVNNSAISWLINGTVTTQDSYVKNQTTNTYPQQQLFQNLYKNTINKINSILINSQYVIKSQSSIINGIFSAKEQLNDANRQVLELQQQLVDFDRNIANQREVQQLSFYIYFGLVIGVSLVISILVLLVGILDMKQPYLRRLLCGGCCLYYFVVFIGFILCIVLVIMNGYLAQGCEYFYDALQNKTEFNQISYIGQNKDVAQISNECLFGQGNLLTTYEIANSLDTINSLNIAINTFQTSQADYNNLQQLSNKYLKSNQDFINNMINATIIDYPNGTAPNQQFSQVQQRNWQEVFIAENLTLAQYNQTQLLLNNTIKKLNAYIMNINQFIGYVSDSNTGILNNADCSFLKNITQTFLDGICGQYFVESYNIYILVGIISISIFVELFLMFKILIYLKPKSAINYQDKDSARLPNASQQQQSNDQTIQVPQISKEEEKRLNMRQKLPPLTDFDQQLCDAFAVHFNEVDKSQFSNTNDYNFFIWKKMNCFGAGDFTIYPIVLQETEALKYEVLKKNPELISKFKERFIHALAYDLKVPDLEWIKIVSCCEGSLRVSFNVDAPPNKYLPPGQYFVPVEQTDFQHLQNAFPGSNPSLELHGYFQAGGLTINDFSLKYNKKWFKKSTTKRGPLPNREIYYYPQGWDGYGLNVLDRYGDNNWIAKDGNPGEWVVMFHGIRNGLNNDVCKKIVIQGLIAGNGQVYQKSICLRTKQIIGKGVYFSNKIDNCECYTDTVKLNGKSYKVVFQSRVNPQFLKECPTGRADMQYFVINDSKNIRPYRVLLKAEN